MRQYYVYILASKSRRLYVGVTNDVVRRVYQHKVRWGNFTARYQIDQLVYYESLQHPMQAIRREKQVKRMPRDQKIALIEATNPCWGDLARDWFDLPSAGHATTKVDPPPASRAEDDH